MCIRDSIGKTDEDGKTLFPASGRLEAINIALAVGKRLVASTGDEEIIRRLEQIQSRREASVIDSPAMNRTPYF